MTTCIARIMCIDFVRFLQNPMTCCISMLTGSSWGDTGGIMKKGEEVGETVGAGGRRQRRKPCVFTPRWSVVSQAEGEDSRGGVGGGWSSLQCCALPAATGAADPAVLPLACFSLFLLPLPHSATSDPRGGSVSPPTTGTLKSSA